MPQLKKPSIILTALSTALVLVCAGGAFWWLRADPEALYRNGLAAVQNERWTEVAEAFSQLESFPEYSSHAALLRGFDLKKRGRFEPALVQFSKANNHPATREESYLQGGRVCYELQQFADCIRLLKQVLEWNPERLEAHQLLAAAYYDIGSMGYAVDSLKNVIRLSPADYRPHYLQGTILLEAERFADAALALEEAAKLAPEGSDVADEIRAEWGNCLIRLRRFEEAMAAMEPAKPWPDVLTRRAQACFSLRRFDEGRLQIDEAIKQRQHHPETVSIAAQLYERSGERDRGISLLQESLKFHPEDLLLHQRLGELLASAGRSDEALQHRNRAGEIATLRQEFSLAHQNAATDAADPALRLKLAELAEKLGKIDLARGWYKAALGLSPTHQQTREQWQQFQSRYPQPVTPPADEQRETTETRAGTQKRDTRAADF